MIEGRISQKKSTMTFLDIEARESGSLKDEGTFFQGLNLMEVSKVLF